MYLAFNFSVFTGQNDSTQFTETCPHSRPAEDRAPNPQNQKIGKFNIASQTKLWACCWDARQAPVADPDRVTRFLEPSQNFQI